jgi:hypothetical protein
MRGIGRIAPWLSGLQGLYYFGPGLWAVFAMRSYEAAHKLHSDYWLVLAHGLFLMLIGCILILAGLRGALTVEIKLLALGMAASFVAASVISVIHTGLPLIYRWDLVIESVFAVLWTTTFKGIQPAN